MSLKRQQHQASAIYQESDGKPMAETDTHARLLIDLRLTLDQFFRDDPDVYVSGNLLLYYVEGDPTKRVAPDVFVVRGVKKGDRRIYKLWEERVPPCAVIELSSRETWREDLYEKWRLYEELGVSEYIIFNPEHDYLMEPLVGFRLVEGKYESVEVIEGRLVSDALGLELVDTGETLRLFDPRRGEFLLTPAEEAAARRREAEARQRAEEEVAALRQEIDRLRGR